jgi:hypothetical protein
MEFFYTGTETIPEGTTVLYCDHNRLTNLPPLPEGLQTLWCLIQCSNNPVSPEELKRSGTINIKKIIMEMQAEIQNLRQKVDKLEEEISLIPEYGENYFKAKDNFNKRQLN